jgi:hypothetical protein
VDIMKASQAQQVVAEDGFSFGLTADHKVVTHSRGTSWVFQSPTGAYLTVTLTEGGNHVAAVGPSNYGQPKTSAPKLQDWLLGTLTFGRNTIPARRHSDGRIERNTKTDGTGEWVEYTGRIAPKF